MASRRNLQVSNPRASSDSDTVTDSWTEQLDNGEAIYLIDDCAVETGVATVVADDVGNEHIIENYDTYHCKSCNLQFESLDEHIRDYHEAQEVVVQDDVEHDSFGLIDGQCTFCPYRFTSAEDFDMHMQVQHDADDEKKPVSMRLTKSTVKNINTSKKKLPDHRALTYCEVCNTTFQSVKSLKLHKRMHLPVRQITIEQALHYDGLTVSSAIAEANAERSLKANVASSSTASGQKTATPLDPDMFYCAVCKKHYNIEFQTVHKLSHTGTSTEKYRCSICNIHLESSQLLHMHQAAHRERTFAVHDRGDTPLPYGCTYCGKAFAKPHEKVKHERIHTGEKPHACEICGKTFRVAFCLTLHMRTHTNVRPYVCTHCSKRFKSHSVYNHHLQTHSDARPYQCPFCFKAFKTAVQLAGHKNSHTKPFSCFQCNRPFSTLYAVKAHMLSHERNQHNMKHVCHVCGASYTRGFALRNHLKEKHPDEPDTSSAEMAAKRRPLVQIEESPTSEITNIVEEKEHDVSGSAHNQLQCATDTLLCVDEDVSTVTAMCKQEELLMSDGSMMDGIIIEVSEEIVVDGMK